MCSWSQIDFEAKPTGVVDLWIVFDESGASMRVVDAEWSEPDNDWYLLNRADLLGDVYHKASATHYMPRPSSP